MKEDFIRKAIAYSGKNLAEVARDTGQATNNFHNKLKRGSFKDDELLKIAEAIGAKRKEYFEFPDGTKIGDWK